MKNLKDIQAINASATMTQVSLEELRDKGQTNSGFRFVTGDVIEIPEEIEVYADHFTIGTENLVYYLIKMNVNKETYMVSVASFRKDRTGIEDSVEAYHAKSMIARRLAGMANDEERVRFLAGKVLKVKELMEAREYRFDGGQRVAYNANDPTTYRTRFWPVFEEME